jgi:hypothetical protein
VQFNDVPVDGRCKERVGASDDEKKFLMGRVTADRNTFLAFSFGPTFRFVMSSLTTIVALNLLLVLTPSFTHTSESYVRIGHESALFHVSRVSPCSFDMLFPPLPCLMVNTHLIVLLIMWYSPLFYIGTLRYFTPPPLYYLSR